MRKLAALVTIFIAAAGLGYLVVLDAVTKTVETQAHAIGEIVARQATVARSVYSQEVAAKLKRDGTGPNEHYETMSGHVPLPAQFLKMVGLASAKSAAGLYEYKPVSRWNLEASQGLDDDFLRWAWPQLEAQERPGSQAPIEWKPVSRIEDRGGQRVMRFLSADPASEQSCVACHNAYEQRPDIRERRAAQGDSVSVGKQFVQHQLMGAVSVTVPLDRAEAVAGSKVTRATMYFFGILLLAFIALMWLTWRLGVRDRSLRQAELQLAHSQAQARSAVELQAAQHELERAFAQLSSYMRGIDQHALVSVTDARGRILQVNDKFVELCRMPREALVGQDHSVLGSGMHDKAFFGRVWDTLMRGEIWRGVICNRAGDASLFWVDTAIVPLKNEAGEVERFIAVSVDITEQRRHAEALRHQATHDGLTALPNRVLLLERVTQAIVRAGHHEQLVVLFFIDLDRFKPINDLRGHEVGDQVLCEIARRLQALAGDGDTVARLGGDEFVIACEGLARDQIEAFGHRVRDTLSQPLTLGGETHVLGGSIGVAVYPDDSEDTETLLRHADIAMYQAKRNGGSALAVYAPEMQPESDGRGLMQERLREALSNGELVLYFQPQVSLSSGQLVGVEALLRWDSAHYGFLSPGAFLPLAEEARLMPAIDAFVLDRACAQMRHWHEQGFGWVRTAINLAPVTFLDPELPARLQSLLARHQVPASALELEVTERLSIQEDATVAETLARLAECGVLLAMDDFGTGASSLSALRHLPADALKVDQSFVRGMLHRPQDRAIVAAIVALGRELGLRVVAEGVETEAEARMLSSLRVEELQGFWAARPQPAQAIEQLLQRRRVLDPVGLQLGRLQDAAREDALSIDSPAAPAPFTPSRYEGITTVF